MTPRSVLDSSAILAVVLGEPGSAMAMGRMTEGAAISSVNWAEVLTRLSRLGRPDAAEVLQAVALEGIPVEIVPLSRAHAEAAAELDRLTQHAGLSLGDRACLALAAALGVPAITADRAWARLDVGVAVEMIR